MMSMQSQLIASISKQTPEIIRDRSIIRLLRQLDISKRDSCPKIVIKFHLKMSEKTNRQVIIEITSKIPIEYHKFTTIRPLNIVKLGRKQLKIRSDNELSIMKKIISKAAIIIKRQFNKIKMTVHYKIRADHARR